MKASPLDQYYKEEALELITVVQCVDRRVKTYNMFSLAVILAGQCGTFMYLRF